MILGLIFEVLFCVFSLGYKLNISSILSLPLVHILTPPPTHCTRGSGACLLFAIVIDDLICWLVLNQVCAMTHVSYSKVRVEQIPCTCFGGSPANFVLQTDVYFGSIGVVSHVPYIYMFIVAIFGSSV